MPKCEVCENFRPDAVIDPSRPLLPIAFGARVVLLCRAHAIIAERSGVKSFDELRDFYGTGRRSFVSRRARAANADTDERRGSVGRRASDLTR